MIGEILAQGQVRRRQLGVVATVQRLSPAIVRQFDLLSDQVVQVVEVTAAGVAQQSGIQERDLIVALNDRITASVDDVHRLLALIPQNVSVDVTLIRSRIKLDFRIEWKH